MIKPNKGLKIVLLWQLAQAFCGQSTQRGKASDSELFLCPWDASVIVKAYHNLGAKNERREEEKKEEKEGGK